MAHIKNHSVNRYVPYVAHIGSVQKPRMQLYLGENLSFVSDFMQQKRMFRDWFSLKTKASTQGNFVMWIFTIQSYGYFW